MIGFTEPTLDNTATPVHHQYDTDDFFNAVKSGNFPSVSFLKAPAVQDAHPGNSDPLDEQAFVTKVLNFLQQQPDWKNTAVIITYDDSDGWYDHRFATPTSSSNDATQDSLTPGAGQVSVAGAATGMCGGSAPKPAGVLGGAVKRSLRPGYADPFVVVSPFAKTNFIDDTQITQASVIKFIEDNWLGGQRIGGGSFDATAGSIMAMFDFTKTTPTRRCSSIRSLARSWPQHRKTDPPRCCLDLASGLHRDSFNASRIRNTADHRVVVVSLEPARVLARFVCSAPIHPRHRHELSPEYRADNGLPRAKQCRRKCPEAAIASPDAVGRRRHRAGVDGVLRLCARLSGTYAASRGRVGRRPDRGQPPTDSPDASAERTAERDGPARQGNL